jgi:ABC-2 type transport system permease protein
MLSIYRKEINAFFSSLIGYIAIVVFLVITGLIVWVFPDTNVLDYGFASLESLFFVAPWVYLFLIPAITMRSFAEEISNGTIEMLTTKPLRELDIILGKYFAALTLVVFSLLPTLIYYIAIYQLGAPKGNLDSGAIWGSYLGLLFLGSAFVAMGMFASSITSNQIVSFVLAAFLCFFFHWSFDFLSGLDLFYAKIDDIIEALGINAHYTSISRGVVDTRDLVYFISFTAIFILLTKTVLESRKWK